MTLPLPPKSNWSLIGVSWFPQLFPFQPSIPDRGSPISRFASHTKRLEKTKATISIPFQLRRGRPRRKVGPKRVITLRAQGLSGRGVPKSFHNYVRCLPEFPAVQSFNMPWVGSMRGRRSVTILPGPSMPPVRLAPVWRIALMPSSDAFTKLTVKLRFTSPSPFSCSRVAPTGFAHRAEHLNSYGGFHAPE